VANGGTGDTAIAAYALVAGGTTTTAPLQTIASVASGQLLASNGTTALPVYTANPSVTSLTLVNPLTVPNGGTGDASFTAYSPVVGGTTTTAALQSAGTGQSNVGYVFTSTGASSLPTWQAAASGGITTIAGNSGSVTGSTVTISGGTTGLTTTGVTTVLTLSGTLAVANGGTNATSFGTTNGIVVYNGTRLVNYAGPTINSAGQANNSTQPAFSAYLSTSIVNTTGDGTNYTILFDTTSLNVGTVYSTGTGLFTAPIAGNYLITYGIEASTSSTYTAGNTYLIVGGSLIYRSFGTASATTTTTFSSFFSILLPLTASQTVGVVFTASTTAGTKNTTITGSSTNRFCSFSGYLVS
jgi:hypothetical protein